MDKFDGALACHISDVAMDAEGNAYMIGDLSSTATVSMGGVELASVPTAGGPDVLVAKFGPDGSLAWVQHAGGTSVDVGLKLAWGPAGLAVTGLFTGAAELFGANVQAEGGSTDLFVALLNPVDGQALWVRTAGSPGYTDTPGGITINSAGAVIVAGKFKGDAVFGPNTLQSAIDPSTSLPSFDVFIAAWSSAGSLQWVKQGTGSKDCLAVDIASGPDDHLYVTGQFSDSITFDVSHPGTVLNAIFLLQLDPQGHEQWFRKLGGASLNQVSDLHWGPANELLMTGDVSGTMHWSDGTTSVPISNASAHAYFILRVSASGALLDEVTMGSVGAVHAASITAQADSVVVFGEFECRFTGLQAAYGADGLFIAKGSPDLFIAKHAMADLDFVGAQQFAAAGAAHAGALVDTPDGLLFSGAFASEFYLPRGSAAWGDPIGTCSFISANEGDTLCGDPNYGAFAWATGTGPATGFLTKGYVEGRSPFDFWDRSDSLPCYRGAVEDGVQITYQGVIAPDTVQLCLVSRLWSVVPFPRGGPPPDCPPSTPTAGPFGHQLWSDGSALNYMWVSSSGWYSFTVFSGNGCLFWTDSVYVNFTPASVFASDSTGTFDHLELVLPSLITAVFCGPTVLWVELLDPGDQVYWVHGADTTFNDTVPVPVSGSYSLRYYHANGCVTMAVFVFDIMEPLNVTGVTSQLVGSDTIQTCSDDCLIGHFTNTWYVDSLETPMPVGYFVTYVSTGGCTQAGTTDAYQPIPWGLALNGTGWYTVHSEVVLLNGDCGDEQYAFTFTDSVYVQIGAVPSMTFASFEVQRCVDDTVAIPFTCTNCDSVIWTGPGVVWISPDADTALVDQNGNYSTAPVSLSGGVPCVGDFQTVVVTSPVPPSLFLGPEDGTVCANDSVLLSTDAHGAAYAWTGPGTAFLPDNDSIWADEPGDYYLTVTLYPGCAVSNGPATVSFFGSPVISGSGSGILCPGGSVVLQVDPGPGGTLQWQAPLFGNAPAQTVYAPGSYSCFVSSCGNTWELSYEVVLSSISADLGADTFALCQGQALTLSAPPGAVVYQWLPSGLSGQQLVVTAPGIYELIATDAGGCSDSSGPIAVVLHSFGQPVSAAGDSICAGQAVTLTGAGSGELFWYGSSDTTDLLATGSVLNYAPASTDTVFIVQVENGCTGGPLPVPVFVQEVPVVPVLSGDSVVCVGGTLSITAAGDPGSTFSWATPAGSLNGNEVFVAQTDTTDAGTYRCYATWGNCTGDTAVWSVQVITCDTVWPAGNTPNVFTPNGDGVNDVFSFAGEAFSQAELRVFNRWGQQVAVVLGRNASWDGRNSYSGVQLSSGVYFYTLQATTLAGEPLQKAGYVHLLR